MPKSATGKPANNPNDAGKELLEKASPHDDDTPILPTPPDGGWGWVIVFGCFMVHVIADGVAYSFGVFLDEFLVYFGLGRGATGWLGSLMIGVTWGSGMAIIHYNKLQFTALRPHTGRPKLHISVVLFQRENIRIKIIANIENAVVST